MLKLKQFEKDLHHSRCTNRYSIWMLHPDAAAAAAAADGALTIMHRSPITIESKFYY